MRLISVSERFEIEEGCCEAGYSNYLLNKNLIRPLKASFMSRLSQLMCNVNILTYTTACSFFSVLTKPQTSEVSFAWATGLKRSRMIDSW